MFSPDYKLLVMGKKSYEKHFIEADGIFYVVISEGGHEMHRYPAKSRDDPQAVADADEYIKSQEDMDALADSLDI